MPSSPLTADLPDQPDPPQDRPTQEPAAVSTDYSSTSQPRTHHPNTDQPGTGESGCTARLLGLVRRLIGYGRKLAGTLRNNPAALEPDEIQHKFGTADMKLILRRITRGILLAAALQAKLIARLEHPERAAAASSEPAPDAPLRLRPKRPARRKPDTWRTAAADMALLARLPSAEEIAERMRYRPIGAVILDIFRDLGILPGGSDGIWHEASLDIIASGGDVAGLFNDIGKRHHKWLVEQHGRDTPFNCADLTRAVDKLYGTGPP
jgi:hypothetical protein